jgi:hypothetical protein
VHGLHHGIEPLRPAVVLGTEQLNGLYRANTLKKQALLFGVQGNLFFGDAAHEAVAGPADHNEGCDLCQHNPSQHWTVDEHNHQHGDGHQAVEHPFNKTCGQCTLNVTHRVI